MLSAHAISWQTAITRGTSQKPYGVNPIRLRPILAGLSLESRQHYRVISNTAPIIGGGPMSYLPTDTARRETEKMPERSRHQEKIIRDYYRNRDAIGLQKAQEAVTELYLSEGKKRVTVWKRLASHLEKIGLPQEQIDHLREQDDPEMVATVLKKFV